MPRRVFRMKMFRLFALLIAGFSCGHSGVPSAEASMRRITSLGYSINDPDVQWLMKQTDLMYIFVSDAFWQTPMEERQNLIQVIESFVSDAIRGPLGVDIREAAQVFERYRLDFLAMFKGDSPNISMFALSLAFALEIHAPGLVKLSSVSGFPLEADRRLLFASLSSLRTRFHLGQSAYFISNFLAEESIEYWEMVLDVYTRVEDRYTWLCQQTGVDVAAVYRPIHVLRSLTWGSNVENDEAVIHSVIPMIDDPQTIDFAKAVGPCLDFALRHHPFESMDASLYSLSQRLWSVELPDFDHKCTCTQLMLNGFQPPVYDPSALVDDGSFLTDSTDGRPPRSMENLDALTIRVIQLVEVLAVRVPEIRQVFQSIDTPTAMVKFERILLNELNRKDARIDRLAYDLARFLKKPILHLPTMRERYLSSLTENQFEGLRRIISCMGHLETLVGDRSMAMTYIDYALKNTEEIELISTGLQALTRLFMKFQQDPIKLGSNYSVARHRTLAGFLPAYHVFGDSKHLNVTKFRQGLAWVIGHESEFTYAPAVTELVSRNQLRVGDAMNIVAEFLTGPFPEFDAMSFAIDGMARDRRNGGLPDGNQWKTPAVMVASSLPNRIFAATVQLGGMGAINEALGVQLLRIVPLFVEAITAMMIDPTYSGIRSVTVIIRILNRVETILDDLEPTDQAILQRELDNLQRVIPSPLRNPALGPL